MVCLNGKHPLVTFVPGTLETPWSKGVFSVRGKAPSSLSLGCRSLQYWSRNSPRCSQASSKMASSRTKSNISCVKQKIEHNTSYRKIHYLTETCLATWSSCQLLSHTDKKTESLVTHSFPLGCHTISLSKVFQVMFTLYRMAFAPAWKPYRIGPRFTHTTVFSGRYL